MASSSALGIDYDGRRFCGVTNTAHGEVSDQSVFHDRQRGDVVWAPYEGGGVRFGTLVASVGEAGELHMRYSHVNDSGNLMTGACQSTPETLRDGLRQWTSGDRSASESVVEEIALSKVR